MKAEGIPVASEQTPHQTVHAAPKSSSLMMHFPVLASQLLSEALLERHSEKQTK